MEQEAGSELGWCLLGVTSSEKPQNQSCCFSVSITNKGRFNLKIVLLRKDYLLLVAYPGTWGIPRWLAGPVSC